MDIAARRLEALRALLEDAERVLGLGIGFELWDGSLVPAALDPASPRLAVADPGVVASLVRRPNLDTLIGLHLAGRLDLKNGALIDVLAKRPRGKIAPLLKRIGRVKALRTAALFLTARGTPPPDLAPAAPRRRGPEEDRRNIQYHYDVSNAFYRLFLDPEMVYSCGYFAEDHEDIARAQTDKLDMICRKLRLKPRERLLDIGCGWGALVCHAAQHYGVEALGITLAEKQAGLARETVERRGLAGSVRIELADYRQLAGEFDKIASIGMFEHVGLANHPVYFDTVHRLLRPRGLYLHHAISRMAKKNPRDFSRKTPEHRAMTRYIFPGGEVDHLGLSVANLQARGFEVHDVEGWREHYARTCRLWWRRLEARRGEAEREVGPEMTRLWLIYLAGCTLAFERGMLGVFQTLASRRERGPSGLPLSRADLYA